MPNKSNADSRPLGNAIKPRSSSDLAREASDRVVRNKPRRVKVIAIADGHDGLRVYKATERFQIALGEKEELPAWAVTEKEWDARAEQLAEDDEDMSEEEIAASLWREKEEALVEATVVKIKAQRAAERAAALATA